MGRIRLRTVVTLSIETLATVVLVLLFFMAMIKMLDMFFPSGTNLRDLVRADNLLSSARGRDGMGRDIVMPGQGKGAAATLTQVHNTVKTKQANAIAWSNVAAGTPLADQDAVQTLQGADATIEFDARNQLHVAENSLVIVQRVERDPVLQSQRSRVLVVDGQLSGRLSQTVNGQALSVEVATPTALTRVGAPAAGGRDAQFEIKINADKSSTIAVLAGTAMVSAQGQTVQLHANQASTVAPDQAPSAPMSLPAPPSTISPAADAAYYYRDLPPRVTFQWRPMERIEHYRLMLARDANFKDILLDERVAQARFTHGNLKEGTYYWRVASIRNWVEGAAGKTQKLSLVRDQVPPALRVDPSPVTVRAPTYLLTGSAEPGSDVFVDGTRIATADDGHFSYEIALNRGANPIVVEASDAAGNSSYESQVISGRY